MTPDLASIFPPELTALRAAGLAFGVLLIAFVIWRRRELSNGSVLLGILGGLALLIVSGTELLDALLEVFAFEQGNGERILGLAVFAIAILFLLVLRALTESARMNQQLSALLEGLAWEEFKSAKLPERFRDRNPPPAAHRFIRKHVSPCAAHIAGQLDARRAPHLLPNRQLVCPDKRNR